MFGKTLLLILASIGLGITGQFLLKEGVMSSSGRIELTSLSHILGQFLLVFQNPYVLMGFVMYGLGSLTWILVLSRTDLSMAYPMLGLGYVVTVALAAAIRHEPVTGLRWLGVFLIVAGVLVIGNEGQIKQWLK